MDGSIGGSRDPGALCALKLRLWRDRCGRPSCRELEKLLGEAGHPSYTLDDVRETLATGRNLDWAFVAAVVTACHRFAASAGMAGFAAEPDLGPWRRDYDEMQRALSRTARPVRAGAIPAIAEAYQRRRVGAELSGKAAVGHTYVLGGPGGVGKTQIAAGLIAQADPAAPIDLVVWATATSRESVLRRYAEAAQQLGIADDDGIEATAEHFLTWLGDTHGRRWLVVLDDLLDPAHLSGLWPPSGTGTTVVTTRFAETASDHIAVPVEPFGPNDSLRYLREALGSDRQRLDGADQLALELGHLPLALAQAAAYVREQDLDCRGYLKRFRHRRLADVRPTANGHADALTATWTLAAEAADARRPHGVARPLLDIAARLDGNGIPAALFTARASLDALARDTIAATVADASDGLRNLARLSLCRLDDDRTVVRVHESLQQAVRDTAGADTDAGEHAVRAAADALLEIWPAVEADATLLDMLRSNAETLLWTNVDTLCRAALHQVVFRAGNSLPRQGLFAAAVAYWERLLPVVRDRLGADHPDTLTVRNNLAWAYGRNGDAERALAGLRDLLPVRRRVLGDDDVNTMATRHGIAVWLSDTGDREESVTRLRELVAQYEQALGADHRDTLNTRLTLADQLGQTECPAAAVAELGPLLDDYRRTLGPDSPETLDAEYTMVCWQAEAGDTRAALSRAETLLGGYHRTLGPDHVDTLWARFLRADLVCRADGRAVAAVAMRKLLDDVLRLTAEGRSEADDVRTAIDRWSTPDDE
ncbi:tetratricopeptide repeat protein [Mangrovihabitans endophyticus]|uniref:Tetratricopeptide repeat-containing protein n=1 Tax=Mangrovihabitans endophyticus TaxID=1751298 RepID=A0A8J3C479_9ACTN|nr:tetratricopeptide repeat protein [Mangrovihabitans endophyticus]GGL04614.1 hypothetical protein GCM10012284_44010 [Mangrovihabitans endophyticus]